MHRRVWFLAAAAVGVLALASSAAAMRTTTAGAQSGATSAFAKVFAANATPAARQAKSTVNFAMEQDAGGFNLANLDFTGSWAAYFGEIPEIRGNYIVNQKGQWVLDMASKVKATKHYLKIWIKKNANWNWQGHKPFPVTGADYIYTWKQIVKPGNNVASTVGYNQITKAKTHGNKIVTFFWKKPFADYKDLFGYIYPKKALAHGPDFNHFWSDCVCGYPDKKPISDGPYFLQSWTPGSGLILKSNTKWYGKKPAITTIVGKLYDQESSEINAFKGGEVDAMAPGQPISSMVDLLTKAGVKHQITPGYTQEHMDLEFRPNSSSGAGGTHTANAAYLFNKHWFAQALAMGLNRQPVINAVYAGVLPKNTVKPLNNPFYTVGANATAKKYQFFSKYSNKPAAAIALLKKHGCTGGPSKPGGGGTWTCQGHKAEVNFYTTTAPARCSISMPAWVQQEAAIGIKLDTKCYTAQPDFFTNLLPTGNFDLGEYAFQGSPDPAGWDDIYKCVTNTTGGQNYKNFCNKKVNKLMNKADVELNVKKRVAIVQAAAKLVSSNVAIIPLYARPQFLFYNSKIKGMSTSNNPTSSGPLWTAQSWKWGS
jgi:peptide/nickel transport system substrate-binding protein